MDSPPVKAVLWDFGGVLTTSPFDAFASFEAANGLPPGFVRGLNAATPDTNAWARLERSEVGFDEFVTLFEAEALAAGFSLNARALLSTLSGELRPMMVEALRRCRGPFRTALLTNNFVAGAGEGDPPETRPDDGPRSGYAPVLEYFDVVIESSKAGCRKPDLRFYELACEMLQIEPAEAVFLDALGVNLKPARAMGMRTIKVVDPGGALAELEEVLGFSLTS